MIVTKQPSSSLSIVSYRGTESPNSGKREDPESAISINLARLKLHQINPLTTQLRRRFLGTTPWYLLANKVIISWVLLLCFLSSLQLIDWHVWEINSNYMTKYLPWINYNTWKSKNLSIHHQLENLIRHVW